MANIVKVKFWGQSELQAVAFSNNLKSRFYQSCSQFVKIHVTYFLYLINNIFSLRIGKSSLTFSK